MTPAEQAAFWARVRKADGDGCWEWAGKRYAGKYGYGRARVGDRVPAVHRLAWELAHGPIPAGMHLFHRCGVRLCVRPDHMVVVRPGQPGQPRRRR